VTGKEIGFGYDTSERPAFLMIPSRQNTEESPRQLQYAVWMMERAIDLMAPGVEYAITQIDYLSCSSSLRTLALLINFADRGKNPSMQTARTVCGSNGIEYCNCP
jgi:CRAL/TRIO domain